ncbi:MAG: TlpA family protein disulfide reductase [Chloroflexi bacterium]|nr:TlpA family protein disulfide reductase [Chloroflexota bacterium]
MSSAAEPAAPAEPVQSAHEVLTNPEPRRRSPRRLIVAAWLVAGAAAVVAFLTVSVGRAPGPVDTPIVGRTAPAFDLQTLDGGRLSLAELRGVPVVLNFWASWCIPCREEAPLLTAADADYRSDGLRVLGVVYQDSADNARAFMRRYGQTYPGLLDQDGRTAIDYGVFGIPETFFIDRSGVVRSRQVGALTGADMRRQIEAILP